MSLTVRPVRPTEGARFRAIRLRALAESPTAFASTLAETESRPASYWDGRVASAADGRESALFVAEDAGDWVGMAGGFVREDDDARVPFLISMWVDPTYRGRGVGGALVNEVIEWARGLGARTLFLEVEATNTSAISLYARSGFRPTGHVQPHPTYPGLEENKMERSLEE